MSSVSDAKLNEVSKQIKLSIVALLVIILLVIVIFALVIVIYVKEKDQAITITTTETSVSLNSVLAESIRIDDAMNHLKELQRIATVNGATRAVNTLGFNQTLDYITNTLTINTDFNVYRTYFDIRQFALNGTPSLTASINGILTSYTYATDLSVADFYHIEFSTGIDGTNALPLTAIPDVGCTDSDWQAASPSLAGRIALVKRGVCGFADKGALATKYGVSGLLIYNDGASSDRYSPLAIGLGQDFYLPALFLSYEVGRTLAEAAQNTSITATVQMNIVVQDLPPTPIGNICADTPSGDITQTIIIGSHSDSVLAGPGINDNGQSFYYSTYHR